MKKAVALLVNDMHITKNTINDFILNWDEMLEQAKANNVFTVIIGGDVFTDRSSQPLEVLITVKKCIEKAEYRGIQLVIALGNHDVVDKMAPFGYPTLFEAYPHVTVVNDAPYQFKLDGDLSLLVPRALCGVLEDGAQAVHGVLDVIHAAAHELNAHLGPYQLVRDLDLRVVKKTCPELDTDLLSGADSGVVELGICIGCRVDVWYQKIKDPLLHPCTDSLCVFSGKLTLDH